MNLNLNMIVRPIQIIFAIAFGFGSVVEFAHFRKYMSTKNAVRMVFTLSAAIACGYMASESLTRDWPSW